MAWDIFLIALGAISIVVGIIGCVLPALPGTPLAYLGLVLLNASSKVEYSWQFFIGWGVAVAVVMVLDYIVPIWGTKKFGGGRKGAWGAAIGVVAGIFVFPPWGLILGPFFGAVAGELMDGKTQKEAIRSGFGSFMGFLAGAIMKLIVAGILAFIFIKDVILLIWN